jgi:drug/metabolite transporter (DMT)-like permease
MLRIKSQLRISNMKPTKSAAIVLALAGVLFLVRPVQQAINGEPLSLTPALATAIGLFLGAIVTLLRSRKSGGRSGPPGA